MDAHWHGKPPHDKHSRRPNRRGFPGIDMDGMTLREIRKRVRNEDQPDESEDGFGQTGAEGAEGKRDDQY